MVLILCGLFCAGKTTLGRLVSEKLSIPFFDTDHMIEATFGQNMSVREIWREVGDESFRDLEESALHSLKKEPSIIATGGGTLLREQNRVYLNSLGQSCYLKCSVPVLYERLLKRGLPASLDKTRPYEHFEEIAISRNPILEQHCQMTLETENLTETETLYRILDLYGSQ